MRSMRQKIKHPTSYRDSAWLIPEHRFSWHVHEAKLRSRYRERRTTTAWRAQLRDMWCKPKLGHQVKWHQVRLTHEILRCQRRSKRTTSCVMLVHVPNRANSQNNLAPCQRTREWHGSSSQESETSKLASEHCLTVAKQIQKESDSGNANTHATEIHILQTVFWTSRTQQNDHMNELDMQHVLQTQPWSSG